MSAVSPLAWKRPGGPQIIQRSSFRSLLCPTVKTSQDHDVSLAQPINNKNKEKHIKFSDAADEIKKHQEQHSDHCHQDEKSEKSHFVIPLFQRTFCWDAEMVVNWWKDVIRGVEGSTPGFHVTDQGLDFHNVGILRLKKCDMKQDDWIVVDGQQRLTTTSLLLASIWHMGRGLDDSGWFHLEKKIRRCLFVGDGVDNLRLVPSLPDRESYKTAIIIKDLYEVKDDSPQIVARKLFDKELKNYIMDNCQSEKEKVDHLEKILDSCLDWMSPLVVELTKIDNLTEIFQWYQEKNLFGLASLLRGIPGVEFGAGDLVRNFVMSVFMDLGMEEQEEVYREVWLEQVEKKAGGARNLEKELHQFLSEEGFLFWDLQSDEEITRYVSAFEKQCQNARVVKLKDHLEEAEDEGDTEEKEKILKKAKQKGGIELYCRFYSYFQKLKLETCGITSSTTDKDIVKLFTNRFGKYKS